MSIAEQTWIEFPLPRAHSTSESPKRAAGSLLQRVILPIPGDPPDVRSLYIDESARNSRRTVVSSRTMLLLPRQAEVSFATYFNAFPASYWRRWSTLTSVELRVVAEGECRIDVYRTKADGTPIYVRGAVLSGGGRHEVSYELDLQPFEDGGWYWFDLNSAEGDVALLEAGWYSTVDAPGSSTVSIGICTFNRPDECASALAALAGDPLVRASLSAVVVADQGSRKVRDADAFTGAAAILGDLLRVHDQPNLGGSGGFARVMHEGLTSTDADHILLLDDDIVVEPDSILRAIAFAAFAEHPTIVGGQMLSLQARSHLRAMGEVVDRRMFMWRPAPNVEYDHDFAKYPLRSTESVKLHRRIDVDYNGWWMCLIPRVIAEKVGLPLPLFIKWDDTEYSLRAQAAGHPTVTVPGVAIWHMPWSEKDDATDWQAYFHLRNRLVVASLHSPFRRGGGLIKDSLKSTLKHLMSLEYSTVALRNLAIGDFIAGPDALVDQLSTALGEVQARHSDFPDGTVLPSAKDLPLPSMDAARASQLLESPTNPVSKLLTLLAGLLRNFRAVRPENHERPQLNIAAQDARWFVLSRLDGATVATADGRGVVFRKRDPRVFWSLLRTAVRSHAQLAREFPRLKRQYSNAMPELTAAATWRRTFGL